MRGFGIAGKPNGVLLPTTGAGRKSGGSGGTAAVSLSKTGFNRDGASVALAIVGARMVASKTVVIIIGDLRSSECEVIG